MVNGGRTPYLWKLQEEQQEAPTDAYLTDDGTSYVIVPETEGEQVDYEKAEQFMDWKRKIRKIFLTL